MKSRPKGPRTIYEVDGKDDVIIVITTADYSGRYAKACRDQIFKGLRLIFVQSGGVEDKYFNIAANINTGMKIALDHNPRWIVFSSDDMYKIDPPSTLADALRKKEHTKAKVIFTAPSLYHSAPGLVGTPNVLYKLFMNSSSNRRTIYRLRKKFCGANYTPMFYSPDWRSTISRQLYTTVANGIFTLDFAIFSGDFVQLRKGEIFDETYITGEEDSDLSIQLTRNKDDYDFVNYQIGDYISSTLGPFGYLRKLRSVATIAYFNYKIEKRLLIL